MPAPFVETKCVFDLLSWRNQSFVEFLLVLEIPLIIALQQLGFKREGAVTNEVGSYGGAVKVLLISLQPCSTNNSSPQRAFGIAESISDTARSSNIHVGELTPVVTYCQHVNRNEVFIAPVVISPESGFFDVNKRSVNCTSTYGQLS